MATLRCLNRDGSREFEAWLLRTIEGSPSDPPFQLLDDRRYSVEFQSSDIDVERRRFASRWDFVRHLSERIRSVDASSVDMLAEEFDGMWDWLSLFYIEDTCPLARNGTRNVREAYRYVMNPSFAKKQYTPQRRKHLLRTPYRLYCMWGRDEPESIDLLMVGSIDRLGAPITHLGLPGSIRVSRGALLAARALFFDEWNRIVRPGCNRSVIDFAKKVRTIYPKQVIEHTSHVDILKKLLAWSMEGSDEKSKHHALRGWITQSSDRIDARIVADEGNWESDGRRRREVRTTIRDASLRAAVLEAYGYRCAVSNLGVVDAVPSAAPHMK